MDTDNDSIISNYFEYNRNNNFEIEDNEETEVDDINKVEVQTEEHSKRSNARSGVEKLDMTFHGEKYAEGWSKQLIIKKKG